MTTGFRYPPAYARHNAIIVLPGVRGTGVTVLQFLGNFSMKVYRWVIVFKRDDYPIDRSASNESRLREWWKCFRRSGRVKKKGRLLFNGLMRYFAAHTFLFFFLSTLVDRVVPT